MAMKGQAALRISEALDRRIDAYVETVHDQTGFRIPKAEVIRKLISDALDAAGVPSFDAEPEAEPKPATPKKRPAKKASRRRAKA